MQNYDLAHVAVQNSSERRPNAKLMAIDSSLTHLGSLDHFQKFFRKGDVFVVNDAATLPASLRGKHLESGDDVEIRLLSCRSQDLRNPTFWQAVVLGPGSWRQKTEDRPEASKLRVGDQLILDQGTRASIRSVSNRYNRLVVIQLEPCSDGGLCHLSQIYENGAPIQYYYHNNPLELWDHQTIFSSKPVALEPPSSAMHLTWSHVFHLMEKGVQVVALTHATGVSTTGDPELDQHLPVPERYDIPDTSAAIINGALRDGRRVIAQGTGVVRALESAIDSHSMDPQIKAGTAKTDLKLSRDHKLQIVDGLLTGMHELDASHLDLLEAFLPKERLIRAYQHAQRLGYLWHEYGDLSLIFKVKRPRAR